ncbi:MAG: sugar phosphate isomerase/epimerase [Alicyclobacillus herbarius]|uniref:sugar phosphate isomerase/epimerase family protein n=1 Tax=Alicyclobacillus herbarius TaxID=122960 RepID=UPI0023548904|nr:sugar phosphate isomerase/epimerase family protein [Alicyclobacillus herbarius]MCL6633198.1 sugar phosphate isomerase/epimerase [Alicyclobacillus herbarius]
MEFGCCVSLEQLPYVRDGGFDFAELPAASVVSCPTEEEWRSVKERVQAAGVPIRGFNVLLPGGIKVVGPEVDEDWVNAYLEQAFRRMAELGAEHVSFGSGGSRAVPDGFDRQLAEDQLCNVLRRAAELGEEYGITVNLEFLNRGETNFLNSLLEAQALVQKLNHPRLRLLVDLYHIMKEQEPLSDLLTVAPDVGYVHVADTDRRYPGSGAYPYIDFAATLQTIEYDGPISVECVWTDMEREMKQAAAFLRQTFKARDVR